MRDTVVSFSFSLYRDAVAAQCNFPLSHKLLYSEPSRFGFMQKNLSPCLFTVHAVFTVSVQSASTVHSVRAGLLLPCGVTGFLGLMQNDLDPFCAATHSVCGATVQSASTVHSVRAGLLPAFNGAPSTESASPQTSVRIKTDFIFFPHNNF